MMRSLTAAVLSAALICSALTNDPLLPAQWALLGPNGVQPGADWPYLSVDRPVTIALIDTGVDLNHPDLQGIFWQNPGEIPGNGLDDDGNGYVDDLYGWNFLEDSPILSSGAQSQHGTHIAGILAANNDNGIGVASLAGGQVQIMVLQVFDGDAGGPTSGVLDAIEYARANGADIVNLSLTSLPADDRLYNAVRDSDMLFVVSAGNSSMNLDSALPRLASYSLNNLISVANLQPDGTLSPRSNYGPATVELAAPGTQILSTAPDGAYGYLSGTSMAAPMVTAAAALLKAQSPDLTPAQLRELLLRAADMTPEVQNLVSGGVLNLASALELGRQFSAQRQTD